MSLGCLVNADMQHYKEKMMNFIDEKIHDYSINHSSKPSALADELEKYTKENVPVPQMIVGRLEASFLGFLVKSLGAKDVLEFGTYTGYSALCFAENLPSDGSVTTLDINPQTTEIAKSFWDRSPVGDKINSLVGPALASLQNLKEKKFDLIFIDADKTNYMNYLKASLDLLSDKGVVVLDNMLWSGHVLNENQDEETEALKAVNEFIKNNHELYGTLLPVRDGMFLVKKVTS